MLCAVNEQLIPN